jgi:AraC-like DNA-binding protein
MTISIENLRAEYEAAVRSLQMLIDRMRRDGCSSEAIARIVHADRRKLARQFKERTTEPMRSAIYKRTIAVYGNAIGPSIESLRLKGKTWEEIAESAARPGAVKDS